MEYIYHRIKFTVRVGTKRERVLDCMKCEKLRNKRKTAF